MAAIPGHRVKTPQRDNGQDNVMSIFLSRFSPTRPARPLAVLLLLASLPAGSLPVQAATPQADPANEKQVQRGQLVYQRFCSLCHGAKLEGQPDWRTRKPDGKLPAPPHDETGHTWHHPDELLFGIIKHGLVPPYAPPNYKSDMPAFADTLKDADIWAVLAYIKSRWPPETRKIQADIDQDSRR